MRKSQRGSRQGREARVGLGQGLAERVLTQVDGLGSVEKSWGPLGGISVLLDLEPERALKTT